jgi:diazepam-binding inhibitor (GABA receptor modulating acyl-CoA-binding protein)
MSVIVESSWALPSAVAREENGDEAVDSLWPARKGTDKEPTMTLNEKFDDAQKRVKALPAAPGTDTLLELYALYKQGTAGDVDGKRPGMLDIKGRAKYDAWTKRRGMSRDAAMEAYVALVDGLAGAPR